MGARAAVREGFREEVLLQGTANLERLYGQSQKANSGLYKFGSALAAEVGGVFQLGKNKDLQTAFNKAQEEYGDVRRLTDLSRGRVIVESVDQIASIQKIFDELNPSRFLQDQAEKGYLVRRFKDKFAEPPSSGYRGALANISVPLSQGGSHIAEIQIHHKGFQEADRATHGIYEAARGISRLFDHAVLPPAEAFEMYRLQKESRDIHEAYAERLGLTTVQRRPTPEIKAPSLS